MGAPPESESIGWMQASQIGVWAMSTQRRSLPRALIEGRTRMGCLHPLTKPSPAGRANPTFDCLASETRKMLPARRRFQATAPRQPQCPPAQQEYFYQYAVETPFRA